MMVTDKLFNSSLTLKVLMVAAMVAGLLVVVPRAQAQGAFTPGGQCGTLVGG